MRVTWTLGVDKAYGMSILLRQLWRLLKIILDSMLEEVWFEKALKQELIKLVVLDILLPRLSSLSPKVKPFTLTSPER